MHVPQRLARCMSHQCQLPFSSPEASRRDGARHVFETVEKLRYTIERRMEPFSDGSLIDSHCE